LHAYLAQYPDPDVMEPAHDHEIVHARARPNWLLYSDYRPGSFAVDATLWATDAEATGERPPSASPADAGRPVGLRAARPVIGRNCLLTPERGIG
jgi:hypothetical protein